MRKSLFAFALGSLFLSGASAVRASIDPPAATPVVPATTTETPAVKAEVDGNTVTATTTFAQASTNDPLQQANKAWSRVYWTSGHELLPDKRISIDKKNEKVTDVLKEILEQAKLQFSFDQELYNDTRISIKLDNVKLQTALDAITDSVGVFWSAESQGNMTTVIVRKKQPLDATRNDITVFTSPNVITGDLFNGKQYVQSLPSLGGLGSARTYTLRSQETRSTFTCPNCHNQVTILRKNIAPKCTTCGRTFEPGWKVCPFDGTKRPEAKDDWKFCPICGKPIPEGTLSYQLDNLNLDWNDLMIPAQPWSLEAAQHSLYHELALPEAVEMPAPLER